MFLKSETRIQEVRMTAGRLPLMVAGYFPWAAGAHTSDVIIE